ncbi:MAG TPA: ABC transporter permease, partial [Terracidiphilus sp.]|nr:ABC transporter permease [Terracidiphilus sp.]
TRQALRERRGLPWLESLFRDLRASLRALAKHPGVTVIAIVSIGLGIGANATIFSMVSRFVLRPAPVGDPSTLVAMHLAYDGDRCCENFPLPVFEDVRKQAKSFSGVAAYDELLPASIGGNGEPERAWGQAVTPNFFDVTQLRMTLGRGFLPGEKDAPLVVLGANLWQHRFNGDPAIIGKSVSLSGHAFTVVGIAPPAFHGVDQILYAQFWVPLGNVGLLVPGLSDNDSSRTSHWLAVVGRRRPGISPSQAAAELNTLAKRLALAYPKSDKGIGFVFERAGSLPPSERDSVLIFLAALSVVALLVLAIAGANVANLLFAQAVTRQRDMAVRLALGATRFRLQRQLLTESVLLGLGGGALGLILSLWATKGLSSFRLPAPVPLDLQVGVDWRVLLFSFAISVVSGMLLGLAPAWTASRPMLSGALKGEDALARRGRRLSLRNLLVVLQISMSVVLLCITGLFLRSLQSATHINIGFRSQNLLMMSVDPRIHGFTPQRTIEFLTQLRQRVAALPGVESVVVTDVAPLSGGHRSDGFSVVGRKDNSTADSQTELYMATPGYFETMGIPLLAGRDFGGETPNSPMTAVVNRAFVQRFFEGENPIGHLVTGGGVQYRVIGVVGNIKSRFLGEDFRPVLYRSLAQTVGSDPSFLGYTLVVHMAGNPSGIARAVRRQIHLLDPSMAIFNEETMAEHLRDAFFLPRLAATLFGIFGGIGLLLAAVGLFGVMSYAVSRRTREIGIRMAMGAQPGTVERLVLRQGFVLTLIAIALGWPAAWMLARLAASFLYGVQPHDPLTFAAVPPFLALIAIAACWIPARRAASVDPMQALRTE